MADYQVDNLDEMIDVDNTEAIIQYFKKKNPKEIKDVMTKQVSVGSLSHPLSYSIYKKRNKTFLSLLDIYTKNKLDINLKDESGLTPLHYAVQTKDVFFIKTVLGVPGINVYIGDNDGQNPFVFFLRFHDEPTVKECIHAFVGASRVILNNRIPSGKYKGDFPLNVAFQNPHCIGFLLETILKSGAVPDVTNFSNEVPLHFAVNKKRLDLVLLLLKYGANINIKNVSGNSPLSLGLKQENKIAAVMSLVDNIHIKMRKEYSLTLQFDLPRFIGIGLFTDVGYSQGIRNMIASGGDPDVVKRLMDLIQKAKADFMETRESFNLLYYREEEDEEEDDEKKKIDAKAIEFLGENISNTHKFGLGLYGDVIRARHKNKTVGLEFLLDYSVEDMKNLEQVINEHYVPLKHDNILQLYGTVFEEGSLWVISEYTDRGCLFDLLQGPKLDWDMMNQICIDMAEGLLFLQEHAITHGGLNSTKVFMTLDGHAKIGEYGWKGILPRKTDKHLITIELAFMAPEQLQDPPVDSPDADKYSYGMIVWEIILRLITGEHVIPYYSDEENYTAETDQSIKKKIMSGNIPTIATRENAQVFTAPPRLGKLYKNICQIKPDLRWAWDKIIEEWTQFEDEVKNDPKKWKNCLQTDGNLCPGEYANKKFKLTRASETVIQ
ncbi:serine-threonine protein kinase, putative [Entamoeba invadens IP1]|uniref:Serine-threonine protein kinase, putative n=1 Tax=Entamoeba invadens IP1 TaxID=370355 RepID=A0A0A1TVY5_ENTIV|nr:serine-threonine protein kinase, putative [Entamoeba invadens IP1]ELP84611.1 serine-threonine protein kinase, putative [Entamoeba invadens IP1]|eukprot:XP_004183957.1 serine-threonine protein kinase, putative [Entamoeba invadens IP1]